MGTGQEAFERRGRLQTPDDLDGGPEDGVRAQDGIRVHPRVHRYANPGTMLRDL